MSILLFDFLGRERINVLLQLKTFSKKAVLGGGTALCMQLNHRKSYDFDLLVNSPIEKTLLKRVIEIFGNNIETLVDSGDELSVLVTRQVKISFIYFPYPHLHPIVKTQHLPIRNWKDIASDKAYAIGRRGEYRDYVDIFFVFKKGFTLQEIIEDADQKFKGAFSSKLFLSQLVYLNDIKDFTVDYISKYYSVNEIKKYLEETVSQYTKNFLK